MMAATFACRVGQSIPAASDEDPAIMEGIYRFLSNDNIKPGDIAEGAFQVTAEDARKHSLILMPQDTTTLAYSHSVAEELGDLGGPENSHERGWFVHSSLLLDASSCDIIGLIDQQWWTRDPKARGKRRKRKERPYEDKESHKWESAMEQAAARLGDLMGRVITVCDREADVYEFLQHAVEKEWRFVVRVSWDRAIEQEKGLLGEKERLCGYMKNQPVIGGTYVYVEQRGGRPARTARVEIRSARVEVKVPKRANGSVLRPVELGWVYALEVDAPEGEEPLEWMLWTREPHETLEEALTVVGYYRGRWRVEEFHKAWKYGCDVEGRRMQEVDNLQRLAVILAFVAVRILKLKDWGKQEERRCDEVLTKDEWQVLWASSEKGKPIPDEAPTMKWAYQKIGRLGGWYDSKRTGRVGMKALWKGMFILDQRVRGWQMAKRMRRA